MLETLKQDVRFGVRLLYKNPGFTFVAALTLALGIGANTAIFSVINAVLLQPLPYQDSDRLVMVWEEASYAGFPRNTPAPANFADWKAQNQVFEDMAALSVRNFNLTGDGEPEKVLAQAVTANFFNLLGIKPLIGRSFLAEEDKAGGDRVVIISYGLWQKRYGGKDDVVGRQLLLNGEQYTVVGIMPAKFQFLESYIGLWVPIALDEEMLANRGSHYLTVIAKMKEGVGLRQAQTDIQNIMQRIAHDYPEAARIGAVVLPLREQLAGEVRQPLIVLLVAVGFVLLIGCANLSNLLLSRAVGRRKEVAVRCALGAGRLRMVRQLLTESLLLALLGSIAGLLFTYWSFSFLRQLIPDAMLGMTGLSIDLKVFCFTLLITICTGVIFGLAPAFYATKIDLIETLKQSGGRFGVDGGKSRLRNALIVAEVSLTFILLVGASLLIQTFFNLRNQYSVLHSENILTMRTSLSLKRYDEQPKRVAFYDQVLERLKTLPSVTWAGYTTTVPLEWKGGTSGFTVEGHPLEPGLSYDANHRQISPDYLKAIGIPLIEGRHLDERDDMKSLPVAIINSTMAHQYWPNEDAIGKRFKIGDPDSGARWLTVVGVAADVRQMGIDAPVKAEMYLPYKQVDGQPWFTPRDLVIRTKNDPLGLVGEVRRIIRDVDPEQPISNIRTMDEILGEETSTRRIGTLLVTAFALLAVVLAAIGIYGVLSYFVTQHTANIGVRLALGAQPRDILLMILRKGMSLTLLGIFIGLISSLTLMRLINSLLFEVTSTDPVTIALGASTVLLIALFACYIPARRAALVDPAVSLRGE